MQTWVGAVQHTAFLPTRRSLVAGCLLVQPARPFSAAVHCDSCETCISTHYREIILSRKPLSRSEDLHPGRTCMCNQ